MTDFVIEMLKCAHLPTSNRSGTHSSFGRIIFRINVSNRMVHASENNFFVIQLITNVLQMYYLITNIRNATYRWNGFHTLILI